MPLHWATPPYILSKEAGAGNEPALFISPSFSLKLKLRLGYINKWARTPTVVFMSKGS